MEIKQWEEIQIPQSNNYSARTGHTIVCDTKNIYLFGGTDGQSRNNDLHKFDPGSNSWSLINTSGHPPPSRSGSQCAIFASKIYFFGGYTKKDGEYFNDLFTFDIDSLIWEKVEPTSAVLPHERTDHTLSLYKDSLYVFGGYDGRTRFNDLCVFEVHLKNWEIRQDDQGPMSRFGHSSVVCQDKLVIFGGWNGHVTLNDVWIYSFANSTWNEVICTSSIPARYRHVAVALGTSMFVFGGVNKEQTRFSDTYELNLKNQYWIIVETSKNPTARTFHRSVIFEGFLYVLGGYDGSRKNDMFRLYLTDVSPEDDIESNPLLATTNENDERLCWKEIEIIGKSYSSRTGHCAINSKGKIYVFGGTDETTRRNDLHEFDTISHVWKLVDCAGEVPTTRSGAKCVEYEDFIYIFGGYTRKDGIYYDDVHRLNVSLATWQKLLTRGEIPNPRTDHTAVIYTSSMYIFAGYDGKSRFNDLKALDLESKDWSNIVSSGSPPMARFGHTAVVYNHCMYIFGGWDGHDTLDDLYQFSFGPKIWYELRRSQGIRPNPRYRHSCVVFESSLFVFGGVDKSPTRFSDLLEYNIEKRVWVKKEVTGKIPSSRTFHTAVMQGENMYILGGFDGKRRNDLHVIKLSSDRDEISTRPGSAFSRIMDVEEEITERKTLKDLQEENNYIRETIKELSRQLENEEEKGLCKICFEKDIDTVFLECAHRLTCSKCATNLKSCPVDRKPITKVIKTIAV
jgi:N-acetylneuraminic acid mutarotase